MCLEVMFCFGDGGCGRREEEGVESELESITMTTSVDKS